MKYRKVIVTNNPKVEEKFGERVELIYMEGARAYQVFLKVKEMLEEGARLTRPDIEDTHSYYRTVCLFYGDEHAPTKRNLAEIDRALKATHNLSGYYKEPDFLPAFAVAAQTADLKRVKLTLPKGKAKAERIQEAAEKAPIMTEDLAREEVGIANTATKTSKIAG
ncbi:MAG: hypothetical protein Q4C25_09300 [Bacillota bacterium]|nr:hypothetical protein [Bacillota bacterium]